MTQKSIAVFRVEGVLLKRGTLSFATYLAANAQGIGERVFRLGHVALSAPISRAFRKSDRERSSSLAYYPLKGMSKDRIAFMAEEYFETRLKRNLLEDGIALLLRAQVQGRKVVLVGDMVEELMKRLAKYLKVDHYQANRLEYVDRFATGRLLPPKIGGHQSMDQLKGLLAQNSLGLESSQAFVSSGSDANLLRLVQEPCVVNPDHLMRRLARHEHWPVLHAGR